MLIFVDHPKERLRLAQMIIKVRVFGKFGIELENVLERLGIAEVQLSSK